MEGPAREMNLTDVAERIEKLITEAAYISQRIEEVGDTLRGGGGRDGANSAPTPEPSGLVPLLSSRIAVLDRIFDSQRQGLNRLAEGLREAPPPTQLGAQNLNHQAIPQRAYR